MVFESADSLLSRKIISDFIKERSRFENDPFLLFFFKDFAMIKGNILKKLYFEIN